VLFSSVARVRIRIRFGVWLGSGYAHVCPLLSVIIVYLYTCRTQRLSVRKREKMAMLCPYHSAAAGAAGAHGTTSSGGGSRTGSGNGSAAMVTSTSTVTCDNCGATMTSVKTSGSSGGGAHRGNEKFVSCLI